MYDDVIIGSGDRGNSAITVFEEGRLYISHNRTSFWIRGCYLDINMTIFKDTDAGTTLQHMIPDLRDDPGKIVDYINSLAFDQCPVGLLMDKITQYGNNRYDEGRADKAAEIRAVLRSD